GRKFPIVHFRSIFEGYPIARHKSQVCDKLVFEVNGLTSIELKYHYPAVADDRDLLEKLIAQEQCCIDAADLLITVSEVTANHLISRGAERSRIRVIPNGVDLSTFPYRAPSPLSASEPFGMINSLSPVLRGEGWGEGPAFDSRDIQHLPNRPLTPTLSPEYGGEGESRAPDSALSTQSSALDAPHSALSTQHSALDAPQSALSTLHSALISHSPVAAPHSALCTVH